MHHRRNFTITAALLAMATVLVGCSDDTPQAQPAPAEAAATADRQASLFEPEPQAPRDVRILNRTSGKVHLKVGGTNDADWYSSRPDRVGNEGFQDAVLAQGDDIIRTLVKNKNTQGAPFEVSFGDTGASVRLNTMTMTRYAQDGSPVTTFSGWGLEDGSKDCDSAEVVSAGYPITVNCFRNDEEHHGFDTLIIIDEVPKK